MEIKAIETAYKGYRFRSRLEARWAVFFDSLGVCWEYEKEGFDLGEEGWFLPDFWLPGLGVWFEVKPEAPCEQDEKKIEGLARQGNRAVVLAVGNIPDPDSLQAEGAPWDGEWYADGLLVLCGSFEDVDGRIHAAGDSGYAFCQCEECALVGIEYEARSDRLPCKRCYHCNDLIWQMHQGRLKEPAACKVHGTDFDVSRCPRSYHGDRGHAGNTPALVAAYRAARSARFEHGEKG
jgi:hypothetical protein